jgi:hypothetical protein
MFTGHGPDRGINEELEVFWFLSSEKNPLAFRLS